jgi:hypothetical protein
MADSNFAQIRIGDDEQALAKKRHEVEVKERWINKQLFAVKDKQMYHECTTLIAQ